MSVVRLLGRSGRILRVSGLDFFDGTPILDIKPVTPDKALCGVSYPSWLTELMAKTDARRV